MRIIEHFICHTNQISNGSQFQVQTTEYSEVISVFDRHDNFYIAMLEDGDPYQSRSSRHFVAYVTGTDITLFDNAPYRFVTQLQIQKPTWWNDANGPYYPPTYYIFEVLKNG